MALQPEGAMARFKPWGPAQAMAKSTLFKRRWNIRERAAL